MKIFTLCFLLSCFTFIAAAQESGRDPRANAVNEEPSTQGDFEDKEMMDNRGELILQWMKENLNINEAQTVQLRQLYMNSEENRLVVSSFEGDEGTKKMQEYKIQQRDKLRSILTAEQLEKYMNSSQSIQDYLNKNSEEKIESTY